MGPNQTVASLVSAFGDFKLDELDAKDSDLLFEVVAAQTPSGWIRVKLCYYN